MTKKEIYQKLIEAGFVKESIDGLLKSELSGLLEGQIARTAAENLKEEPVHCGPALRVTHKFGTELWLADRTRVFKRDNKELYANTRVNSFLRKEGDKWVKVR